MALFDEDAPKSVRRHEIGQDLALLSAEELRERIAMLKAEIARLESDLDAKGVSRAAAEAFFRR